MVHLPFGLGVPAGSPFDGQTLAALGIRSRTGAAVVGIIRSGNLLANPDGRAHLEKGDLVAVLGTRDQIARFEEAARASAPMAS